MFLVFEVRYTLRAASSIIGNYTRTLHSLTQYFYRGSNHSDQEALTQMVQKANRMMYLSEQGYQRKVEPQSCSICRKQGHNKRSCPSSSENSLSNVADDRLENNNSE